jgi:hypothetical protein
MGGPLRTPGAGDPIPTDRETWGAIIAAARAARSDGPTGAGGVGSNWPPAVMVFVRNDTGDDLPEFGVVAIDTAEPLVSPVDAPEDVFAVLIEPIEEDGTGRALVMGVAVCDVYSAAGAAHTHAAPRPGHSDHLQSAESGPARVIWRAAGSGAQRAMVLLTGSGGAASSDDGCVGCAWLAGLRDNGCLAATLISVTGACDCADEPDPVTDCSVCAEAPAEWTFTVSGFGGSSADLNGTWTVTHTAGACVWTSGSTAPKWSVDLATGVLTGTSLAAGHTVTFALVGSLVCCGPNAYASSALGGSTYTGGNITLTAAGPCETPDTWDCVDGVCVLRTDGSGEFETVEACIANPCGEPPNPGSQACCPGSPKMTAGTIDVVADAPCAAYDTGGPHAVFYFETATEASYTVQNTQGDVFLVVCHSDGTWTVTMADHTGVTRTGVVSAIGCNPGSIGITASFLMMAPPCNGSLTLGATFTP